MKISNNLNIFSWKPGFQLKIFNFKTISHIKFLGITAVFTVLVFIFLPNTVFACSCVGDISQEDSYKQSGAVFIGRVVSINKKGGLGGMFRTKNSYRNINFSVTEYWKGDVSSATTVVTGFGGGDCGYLFVEGEVYLVYAHFSNNGHSEDLMTNICSRTERLRDASGDLAILGPGNIIYPNNKKSFSIKEKAELVVQLVAYPVKHSVVTNGSLSSSFLILFFYYVGPLVLVFYFLYKRFKK